MLCHLVISGFVQGVGYRRFVKKTALRLGLTGWVKNIDKNKVEVLLSGSKKTIEKILEACYKGPFLADIKNIDIEWEDKNVNFKSFEIIV